MMQELRSVIRKLGFDVVRYRPRTGKSQRTNRLTKHVTQTGTYFLPTDAVQDVVANTIIDNGIFEQEVVDLARGFIKPGTTVLDVGANFGQMSKLFADMVGDEGTVYSFEADDFIFSILQKNIEANQKIKIIKPMYGAVHDTPNSVLHFPEQDFQRFSSYGSYGIDFNSTKGREVRTLTIDDLNIETPISFMKVDIQGGDLFALKGAEKTIRKHQMPILFEYEYQLETDFGLCFQEYVDFVAKIGYRFDRVITGHNYLIQPKK